MFMILLGLIAPQSMAASGPYMWGVGPVVNTMVLPGQYPVGFPKETKAEDPDGKMKTLMDKTGGDIGIGVHGVLYMKKAQRVGGHAWIQKGGGDFSSQNITLEYDFAGDAANGVTVLAGVGGGFGKQKWDTGGVGELTMNTYILRGQGGVNYRTKRNCYEVGGYVNWNIPGKQLWDERGDAEEVEASGGFYPTLRIEATMFFGDFRPPQNRGGGKGRRKKSGRR